MVMGVFVRSNWNKFGFGELLPFDTAAVVASGVMTTPNGPVIPATGASAIGDWFGARSIGKILPVVGSGIRTRHVSPNRKFVLTDKTANNDITRKLFMKLTPLISTGQIEKVNFISKPKSFLSQGLLEPIVLFFRQKSRNLVQFSFERSKDGKDLPKSFG
jgi:hypothetical protein